MSKSLRLLLFLVMTVGMVFSLTACAGDEMSDEGDSDQAETGETEATDDGVSGDNIVVMTTGEWEPFTSDAMEGKGFFCELVTAAFNEAGYEAEYEFHAWERAELMAEDGDVFAAIPYSYTESRAEIFLFSDEVAIAGSKFFYKTGGNVDGAGIDYKSLDDVQDFKIGGIQGYFYQEAFDAHGGLDVEWVANEESAVRMLQEGRVDLVLSNEIMMWALIGNLYPDNIGEFETIENYYSKDELYVMASKTYPDSEQLLADFNAGLNQIRADGTYDRILEKYGL